MLIDFVVHYKYLFISFLVLLVLSFLCGRLSVKPETITKTMVQTEKIETKESDIKTAVEEAKKEWEQNSHAVVHTVIIRQKDGTVITNTTSDTTKESSSVSSDTKTATENTIKNTASTTQTTTTETAKASTLEHYSLGAFVESNKLDVTNKTYRIQTGYRILGPAWVNFGFDVNTKNPSLGLTITF